MCGVFGKNLSTTVVATHFHRVIAVGTMMMTNTFDGTDKGG
jgi:hypothetical protein